MKNRVDVAIVGPGRAGHPALREVRKQAEDIVLNHLPPCVRARLYLDSMSGDLQRCRGSGRPAR